MSNPAVDLASTIQSASIKHHPDPAHDLNPSTAASQKRPVSPTISIASAGSIPCSALKPVPRRANFPPLPDLRFEQSYLSSLQGAETWWKIAWITGRDQVLLPLVQGTMWTLALSSWRYWNKGAAFSGQTMGAKMRKWWWGVNDWKVPDENGANSKPFAEHVGDVSTYEEQREYGFMNNNEHSITRRNSALAETKLLCGDWELYWISFTASKRAYNRWPSKEQTGLWNGRLTGP